jgi:F420-dependent oxidoreductase-like protein
MIEIAIMIEGQDGLNWTRWQRIAAAVEDLGFAGLFRSDHYTNANPPDKDSLELWVSLTWLASHTRRIEFGPLVSPVSFRHPTLTARMAVAVDDLSQGRLVLGVGAGWQDREHANYGWDLLDPKKRFDRLEEGLQVITQLLRSDQPVSYQGEYFHLQDAIILPHPTRIGGPPVLIGGNGVNRTLSLAARYADEWNAVYIPAEKFSELNARLDVLLEQQKRKPADVRRSLMTGCVFGKDAADVQRKVQARTHGKSSAEELQRRGLIVGTPPEFVEQLDKLALAGVQRVMLQWLDQDDVKGLEILASEVLPLLSN